MGKKVIKIGIIGDDMVQEKKLDISPDTPIYMGKSNQKHIKEKHPKDYAKHYKDISDIIANPDYTGINSNDLSLEYYKDYGNQIIKLSVRKTKRNIFFLRTMYSITKNQYIKYLKNGRMKKISNKNNISNNKHKIKI